MLLLSSYLQLSLVCDWSVRALSKQARGKAFKAWRLLVWQDTELTSVLFTRFYGYMLRVLSTVVRQRILFSAVEAWDLGMIARLCISLLD